MIADRLVDYKVNNREIIQRGFVWDLRRDDFEFSGETLSRDYVVHPGAVGVIALNHEGAILLVEQYRHAQGKVMWEAPAGLLDAPDEDPLEAIKRELLEETGYVASKWNVLVDVANTPGGSSEQIRIYFAQGITEHPDGRPQGGAEELDMPVHWIQVSEVLNSIAQGLVTNPVLVTGTLALLTALAEPELILRDANSPWPARADLLSNDRVRLPNPKN